MATLPPSQPPPSSPSSAMISSCQILWSTQSGRSKACARRTARILGETTPINIQGGIGSPFDEVNTTIHHNREGGGGGGNNNDVDVDVDHDVALRGTTGGFIDLIVNHLSTNGLLLLFVSTTGDGEHCDSILQTWKLLLQKSLPRNLFQGKQFALFCLGDRAYGSQFCAAGRKLAIRLLQLGMKQFCEVGYGDDMTPNGGVFRDMDIWLEETLLPQLSVSSITRSHPSSSVTSVESSSSSPYQFEITKETTTPTTTTSSSSSDNESSRMMDSFEPFFARSCPLAAYHYNNAGQRMISSAVKKYEKFPPLIGRVLSNDRITAPDWEQDTRHIVIDWKPSSSQDDDRISHADEISFLPYQAGDIATILPCNSDRAVQLFLQVLPTSIQVLADSHIDLQINEDAMTNSFCRWPSQCTLRGWLTYCADFHSLPEREDLRALSPYCSLSHERGTDQRDMLLSLSETKGAALYGDYILREKRSWTEVLFDFDSIRDEASGLSVEDLFVLLPPIRPRHFSIASAPSYRTTRTTATTTETNHDSTQPRGFQIELCVAVVEGITPLGRSYHGLCSKYLSRLVPSLDDEQPTVRIWIQPGSFRGLPLQLSTSSTTTTPQFEVPILCVGAGTGIAPLRSLILERHAILSQAKIQSKNQPSAQETPDEKDSDNILVFGCRKKVVDYYYQDEWEEITRTHGNQHLRVLTAFSRDQVQRVYVQRVLREADGTNLICRHILERNGAVYIAGGPQMAKGVKEEIIETLGKTLGDEKLANQLLAKLQRTGKFSIEAWS